MGECPVTHKAKPKLRKPHYRPERMKLRHRIEVLLDQPWPIRWPGWIERGRMLAGLRG